MKDYQRDFISFLLQAEALLFGEFTLKSGRRAPYFFNSGKFDSGEKIERLGSYYARHIADAKLYEGVDVIFGPAYKGIPLAVITASAPFRQSGLNFGFTFDRKEVKSHGDVGKFVGAKLTSGTKVLVVEDVITAGTTLTQLVELFATLEKVSIKGMLISLDRCERGGGSESAVQEAKSRYGVNVYSIITVYDIIDYLEESPDRAGVGHQEVVARIRAYLAEYGVK